MTLLNVNKHHGFISIFTVIPSWHTCLKDGTTPDSWPSIRRPRVLYFLRFLQQYKSKCTSKVSQYELKRLWKATLIIQFCIHIARQQVNFKRNNREVSRGLYSEPLLTALCCQSFTFPNTSITETSRASGLLSGLFQCARPAPVIGPN